MFLGSLTYEDPTIEVFDQATRKEPWDWGRGGSKITVVFKEVNGGNTRGRLVCMGIGEEIREMEGLDGESSNTHGT